MSAEKRQTCQHCGRRVANAALVESRDPWDGKVKWVCADADSCALVRQSAPAVGTREHTR